MLLNTVLQEPEMRKVASNIKILFISAHRLWAESLCLNLANFMRVSNVISSIIKSDDRKPTFEIACKTDCSIIIISSPGFIGSELSVVRDLRTAGCIKPILVLSSYYSLPSLDSLKKYQVQGISHTSSSLKELEDTLYEVIDTPCESLKQSYKRVVRSIVQPPVCDCLSELEKQILRLLALGLTDGEIADNLSVNTKTVSNQLPLIYAKLQVQNRTGAVGAVLMNGTITPHEVLSSKESLQAR